MAYIIITIIIYIYSLNEMLKSACQKARQGKNWNDATKKILCPIPNCDYWKAMTVAAKTVTELWDNYII